MIITVAIIHNDMIIYDVIVITVAIMTSCDDIITHRVVALQMSPVNDTFLTGSLDKTVRLWDLKSPNCQVTIHCHGDVV